MFATTHPRAHRLPHAVRVLTSAGLALLLLIPTAAHGQSDTDDDGVLPSKHTQGTPQQATASGLVVAGELLPATLDGELASVDLRFEGPVEHVLPSQADEAHAAPVDGTLRAQADLVHAGTSTVRWQGEGALNLAPGLDAALRAAIAATLRTSVIFATDASASVTQVLDGQALPLALDVLGDVPSLDLRHFAQLVASYGAEHPGLDVTWVMVSAEPGGPMRLIAVTASTDGGPLRIAVR